jgi:uncharacterized membrane protein YeiH
MTVLLKTILVLMAAIATFGLGWYSVEFSGSAAAWAAVVSCLVILAISLCALMFGDQMPSSDECPFIG